MNQGKFYSIIVGMAMNRPAPIQIGFLGDDGKPKGTPAEGTISTAGLAVPNWSIVWGKLKRAGDKPAGELTGEIEYYPWNSDKGEAIQIRYLSNCSSLSVEYQNFKKFVPKKEDAEIHLKYGVNDFALPRHKKLAEFIQHHYQNGSNESRDPEAQIAFYDYSPAKIMQRSTLEIESRQAAENIIIGANHEDKELEILATLFGIDSRQQTELLFNELMDKTQKPVHFHEVISHHRQVYAEKLAKAIDTGLIDLSLKESVVLVKEGARRALLEGLKLGDMAQDQYMLNFYYKPNVFNALDAISNALEEYQKQVN